MTEIIHMNVNELVELIEKKLKRHIVIQKIRLGSGLYNIGIGGTCTLEIEMGSKR